MATEKEIWNWEIALRALKEWANTLHPLEEKSEFTRGFNAGISHAKEHVRMALQDLEGIEPTDTEALLKETDELIKKWEEN